jgi:galactose mutarotase-like enzyme
MKIVTNPKTRGHFVQFCVSLNGKSKNARKPRRRWRKMKQVTIQNNFLTVTIDALGAELSSIRDADGNEQLWQGDERFWTSRAPILFPIVGGLKGDTYQLNGKSYTLPKHGFACRSAFHMIEQSPCSATFTLPASEETKAGFPYDFLLTIRYVLENRRLAVHYTIDNASTETMYASIGAHEGYACPEGIEAYAIHFEQEETLRSCLLEGNCLNGKTKVVLNRDFVLPLNQDLFSIGSVVLGSVRSQAVTLVRRSGGRRIHVSFPGFPSLGIWTLPGAPYVCIEPWCGLPDETKSTGKISEKRGILAIPAGQSLKRCHTLTIDTTSDA